MGDHINDFELNKLVRDLERLQGFLEARRTWIVRADRVEALTGLYLTLVTTVRQHLVPLMQANGVVDTSPGDHAVTTQQPSSELDGMRLHAMHCYLERLGTWLAGHAATPISDDGKALLGVASRRLRSTARAIRHIARLNGIDLTPLGHIDDADQDSAPHPALRTADAEAAPPTIAARLVLDDSDQRPLLQRTDGRTQLTQAARLEIARFLHEGSVELDGSDRVRFERRIQEWIEATPPEHVLLLRVSALSGRPLAYPNYAHKADLQRL